MAGTLSMSESKLLQTARERLARAEAEFQSDRGLSHLEEGLALLDEVAENDDAAAATLASNVAAAYATKIFGRVRDALDADRALPQPALEHFFKLMLAFDTTDFELPREAQRLKIAVVRRLVELYYEGYPAEKKQAALAQLTQLRDET
jgi:hypothetical protein